MAFYPLHTGSVHLDKLPLYGSRMCHWQHYWQLSDIVHTSLLLYLILRQQLDPLWISPMSVQTDLFKYMLGKLPLWHNVNYKKGEKNWLNAMTVLCRGCLSFVYNMRYALWGCTEWPWPCVIYHLEPTSSYLRHAFLTPLLMLSSFLCMEWHAAPPPCHMTLQPYWRHDTSHNNSHLLLTSPLIV